MKQHTVRDIVYHALQGHSVLQHTRGWPPLVRPSHVHTYIRGQMVAPGLFAHTLGQLLARGYAVNSSRMKEEAVGCRSFCSSRPSYATTRLPPQNFYGNCTGERFKACSILWRRYFLLLLVKTRKRYIQIKSCVTSK